MLMLAGYDDNSRIRKDIMNRVKTGKFTKLGFTGK